MDLDLKQLGTTLAVGVFVAFGMLVLSYTYLNLSFLRRISRVADDLGTGGKVAGGLFSAVVVLICGIIGEDVSNKFVDADYARPYRILFKSEGEMRAEVLWGQDQEVINSPLAKELSASGRLARYVYDPRLRAKAFELQNDILNQKKVSSSFSAQDIRDIANAAYYPAKNTVFQKEAYAKELASIQTRVDFARSLAIYSIFFFIVGFVLFGIQLVWLYSLRFRAVVPFWPSPPCPSTWLSSGLSLLDGVERPNREVWRILGWRAFWLQIGAFGLIFYFSQKAYYAEEREFNIRAYGYFATLDDSDLPKIQWNLPDFAKQSDISGMIRWKESKLLVVHDAKADTEPLRPRVNLIDTSLSGNQYEPVDITWPVGEDVPSDLESVCWITGRTNELLVAESGYYEGRYGRIFRLRIEEASREKPARAQVVERWHWPRQTDEIEGLSCVSIGQRHLLIAGRRDGTLLWGVIRFDQAQRSIEFQGKASLPSELLNQLPGTSRKITDLHVDDDQTIWASAAYEPPESGPSQGRGPFRSIIYNLGTLGGDESNPIRFNTNRQDVLVLEGLKVEGLTSAVVPGSRFTVGTDDESLGSVWRALAHPKFGTVQTSVHASP